MDQRVDGCIAFQGGGALGIAHLGAWRVLADRFRIVGVSGTSAGSIVAALCGAGYSPDHAIDVFKALEWPKFVKPQIMRGLMGNRDGWTTTEQFYRWMQTRLKNQGQNTGGSSSFAALFARTNIYLAITASDLNEQTGIPVVFDNRPVEADTDVAFAVRASIAIPGYFVPVPRLDRSQMLVDGGLLLNLPAKLLRPLAEQRQCPIIGVRFAKPRAHLEDPNVIQVLGGSLNVLMAQGNQPLQDYPNYLDVEIDVAGYGPLDFAMQPSDKEDLIRRGEQAATLALAVYDRRIAEEQLLQAQQQRTPSPSTSITPPITLTPADLPVVHGMGEGLVPAQPAAAGHQLTLDEKRDLVNLLLACDAIRDPDTRQQIINELRYEIHTRIRNHAASRAHVTSMVNTCANFVDGIRELIRCTRFHEGNTVAMQTIDCYMEAHQL